MLPNAIPKPPKRTKTARLREARERRATRYGGGDWQAQKAAVLARDRYRCRWCGADHCATGIALEVHHARAHVGMGGSRDPDRFSTDDMLTLCPPCHRNAEAAIIPRAALLALLESHPS